MPTRVLPVGVLNRYIHDLVMSDEILADVWIEGEVTRISSPRSGHLYFTLCEGDAVIDAVMWKSSAARQMFIPQPGDAVVVHGRADFYEAQGRLQILADVFEHQGRGILALEFERLRQRLEAEGLFDSARKRPLPLFPRRIGVITSASGAVWHDMQTVARHRYPMVELVLVPASVQGGQAPAEIAAAIAFACELEGLDLLVVGRGGGSPEDLAAFNSEIVARAVFASRLPVVSAVGHETDVSICDMTADLRAATPSAAMELVLPDASWILDTLDDLRLRLHAEMRRACTEHGRRLDSLLARAAVQSPRHHLLRGRESLGSLRARSDRAMASQLRYQRDRLVAHDTLLRALSPPNVLRRGFAAVRIAEAGSPVTSTAQLTGETPVVVTFFDGTATGTLTKDGPASD